MNMARKNKVEVDEEAMRRMIAGLVPKTVDVVQPEHPPDEPPAETSPPTSEERVTGHTTESRRRRTAVVPEFEPTFMSLLDIHIRGALYVSLETKRKILEVVKKVGGERMTATSYVEQILRQHLDLYKEEINRIYKERSTKDLL